MFREIQEELHGYNIAVAFETEQAKSDPTADAMLLLSSMDTFESTEEQNVPLHVVQVRIPGATRRNLAAVLGGLSDEDIARDIAQSQGPACPECGKRERDPGVCSRAANAVHHGDTAVIRLAERGCVDAQRAIARAEAAKEEHDEIAAVQMHESGKLTADELEAQAAEIDDAVNKQIERDEQEMADAEAERRAEQQDGLPDAGPTPDDPEAHAG